MPKFFYAVEIVETNGGLADRYYIEEDDWILAGKTALDQAIKKFGTEDLIVKSVILKGRINDTTHQDEIREMS